MTLKANLRWILILVGAAGLIGFLLIYGVLSSIRIPFSFPVGDVPPPGMEVSPPPPQIVPPPADGFDFPVGPPDAKKYYNAQKFQENNHLGEDWNGNGGGNTDKGDPVYAAGAGIVTDAEDYGAGWGNVVVLRHNIGTLENPKLIESLYAHLDQMKVQVGDTLRRGQQLGTIGDAHGAYWAHLHFEMRHQIDMGLRGGYGEDTTGFLVPTKFIQQHRKK